MSEFLAAVLEQDPSFRTVDALHARTGGNPFFLEELVAGAGDLSDDDLEAAPLPWTVAEAVRRQVDGLDPAVRAVVAAASVLGRRVPFDLLAAVTGTEEAELIEHLRAAVDTGLLVEADADVFSFHHDLAREAIEGGLLGRERRRLHEAALEALRQIGSHDHVALTHHARGAGRYDEMVQRGAARRRARPSASDPPTRPCSWPRPACRRTPTILDLRCSSHRGGHHGGTARRGSRPWRPLAGRRSIAR